MASAAVLEASSAMALALASSGRISSCTEVMVCCAVASAACALLDGLLRLLRRDPAATTITPTWIERHDQRRGGDDPEEDDVPIGHNVSGVPGACGGFALRAWL